jgi:hypothetical protein
MHIYFYAFITTSRSSFSRLCDVTFTKSLHSPCLHSLFHFDKVTLYTFWDEKKKGDTYQFEIFR